MTNRNAHLLPALLALGLAQPVLAAPALWEVRDADSAIWLFGSFHVLPEQAEWRTPLFNQTLAQSDRVFFETDIRPAAMADIGAAALARGIYTDGTLLTDVLDDTQEAKLRAQASASEIPVGAILAMRPWMAANTISVAALTAKGFGGQGVEFLLAPEVSAERIGFLETNGAQIEILAGAPEAAQVAMLVSTLDELPDLSKTMTKMLSHWISGTPERLADLFISERTGSDTAILERLLYARNRNWQEQIEQMLAENSQNLVVIGAAHLVGEGSVVDLLEQAGYRIERIQ